jgi:hypothetical protein
MKKKFVIPMALVMTVALSVPLYVSADSSSSSATDTSITTTTTNTSTSTATSTDTNAATDGSSTASTTTTTPTTPSNLSLSLADALNLVEKGYNQIVLDDRYIQILDKQYQEAVADQQALKETAGSSMQETDAETFKLNAPVALYTLNNEKHQRDIDLKNAKVTVQNEYEGILAAQMNVTLINQEISNLQKDMDSINEKIKVGMDKPSDIEQDKATMATYEANLASAQNGIKSQELALKNDLGIDLNTNLTLTSAPMDYVKYDDTNIDGKIQDAIKNSYNMTAMQQQIDNAQIQYDIYKEYSDGGKDATEINIEDLKNQLNQMPNNIEVQLKSQYNSLKSLENTVEADNLSIEAAQITLNTVQANYNLGQAVFTDVSNAQLQLANAKNTLQQDIISYMTASANFQNSLQEQ